MSDFFKVEELSTNEEERWRELKEKMSNNLKQNIYQLLSKMRLDERILFIRYFMKNFKEKLVESDKVSANDL